MNKEVIHSSFWPVVTSFHLIVYGKLKRFFRKSPFYDFGSYIILEASRLTFARKQEIKVQLRKVNSKIEKS